MSAIFVLATGVFTAAPAENRLNDTRATFEKWVETRQLIGRTKADWQADKELIGQTIQMFERELRANHERMSKVSTNNMTVEAAHTIAAAEKQSLVAGFERLKSLVAELESTIQRLTPAFPPPLKEKLQSQLQRLASDPHNAKTRVTERVQLVVSVLNEIDKFNGAITVASEVQKNSEGAEVQVETMYLGLAQAYFADKSGRYAGLGIPTRDGWKWEPLIELAPKIRKALDIYKNAVPAAFVELPVQIQ